MDAMAASEVVQEFYPRLLAVLKRSPSGLNNPWPSGDAHNRTDVLRTAPRYLAARCAAAAAAHGFGKDTPGLNEDQRLRLRDHAREWLQADVDNCIRLLTSGTDTDRDLVGKNVNALAGRSRPCGTARTRIAQAAFDPGKRRWERILETDGRGAPGRGIS